MDRPGWNVDERPGVEFDRIAAVRSVFEYGAPLDDVSVHVSVAVVVPPRRHPTGHQRSNHGRILGFEHQLPGYARRRLDWLNFADGEYFDVSHLTHFVQIWHRE